MIKKGCWLLILPLLLLLLTLPVGASTPEQTDARVTEEYRDFINAIPPEVAELVGEELFESEPEEAEKVLRERGGISHVLSVVGKLTGLSFRENFTLLARICAILLLGAVLQAVLPGKGEGAGQAFAFFSTLSLVLLILALQRESFTMLSGYFTTLRTLSVSFLPLMGTLYAMGGNVRTAVVNHGVMSAFLSVLETLCAGTVLPVAGICLALVLPEALSGKVDLRPISFLIKRTYTLCISFLMLLLCGVLGIQTTLAKAGDTLALRTARFAAGSFLPVVGGSVSETLRTVAGSVEYLRAVAGTSAITVLFFAFLPMFISLLFTRITFLLGGAVAKLLSCTSEEKVLGEFASIYGYFLAILSSLFVMLIFSFTLFARCAAA